MIPLWPEQAPRQRYEIPSSIWSSVKNASTISEAVCNLLMRKDVFSPMLYPIKNHHITLPARYGIIDQFVNSDFELGWDYVEKTSVIFGLFEKLYYVCYNIFHFFICGTTRYENRQDFILLKILETINLEDAFKDKEFLNLSYFLRLKLIKKLRIYSDINYQILARQIIQKIDAVHRQFNQFNRADQEKYYPGLPPHLAYDKQYMLVHLTFDGMALRHCPHFQNIFEFVKRAYLQNPESLQFASLEIRNHKPNMLELISLHDTAYQFCSSALQNDLDIKRQLLQKNGLWLSKLDKTSKENPELMMAALQSPACDFSLLVPFKANREIMLYAYSKNCPLKAIDPCLLLDKEFTIRAIPIRGWDVYMRCHESLKQDKEVKLVAYKKRYLKKRMHDDEIHRLHRSFLELFNDSEFVMHCLSQNGKHFRLVSARLKKDQTIILQALKTWPQVVHEIPASISGSKEFLVRACKIQGSLIQNVSDELSHDIDIIHSVLDCDTMNFSYLPIDLQRNSAFLKSIITRYPQVIYHIDTSQLQPIDALDILKSYGSFYLQMPQEIKISVPHILAAFSSDPRIINSINPEVLRSDPELSRLYILQKLETHQITIDDASYLPLPLPNLEITSMQSTDLEEDKQVLKSLLLDPHSDLKEFIKNMTPSQHHLLGSRNALGSRRFEERKLEYLKALIDFESKLIHEKAYIGTPKPTDVQELKLFWATIRFYLSKVGQVLLQDKSLNKERMDILEACLVCGGGLLGQLNELHVQLCEAPNNSLEEILNFKISRIACAKIGLMNPTECVHTANMLKWHLHAYIGGPKIVRDFLGYERDELTLMLEFFKLFSPKQIVNELCEDLKHDELFQEMIDRYVEDKFMPEFILSESVLEALKIKKEQFALAKASLDHFQERTKQLLRLFPSINQELFFQGISVLFRAGDPKVIYKTLEMTFRGKLNSLQIRTFYEMKDAFHTVNLFFQGMAQLTGLAKPELTHISIQELNSAFEDNLTALKQSCAEDEFTKKYRNKMGLLNTAGMAKIIKDLKFLEKFT